jgi:hypothetical protein
MMGLGYHWVGSGRIILLFFLSDLIIFGSNFFDPYPIRSGCESTRPDQCKIIKYLLNILYYFK